MFGEPAQRLLGPPYGTGTGVVSNRQSPGGAALRGDVRLDWQGQLIAMSADRARDFLSTAEATNVGAETIDQLANDVRRLTRAYPVEPLETLLSDIVSAQGRAFGFLEGRQRPEHSRDLYLLAGVASGLLAKASHDLGAPHDALTQARAAYACADNAGHDGLRAWTRGLQSMISYWSGRLDEALRYTERVTGVADRGGGTGAVWLIANHARARTLWRPYWISRPRNESTGSSARSSMSTRCSSALRNTPAKRRSWERHCTSSAPTG